MTETVILGRLPPEPWQDVKVEIYDHSGDGLPPVHLAPLDAALFTCAYLHRELAAANAREAALVDAFARSSEREAGLREALEWYAEQTRLCRLVHSGGDTGRKALNDDGGDCARAALAVKP